MTGREVVIVAAARTPIGRGYPDKGWFSDTHPNELMGAVYRAVTERIDPGTVEEAVVGCVAQVGAQAGISRNAWLQAGLPEQTPAVTVERKCGSGQQAVNFGAALIAAGLNDIVVAGGVEHMGRVGLGSLVAHPEEFGTPRPPELLERYPMISQGLAAELMAERWGVSREEQDEIALRSHERAVRATDEGRFAREIIPIEAAGKIRSSDQGIRRDTSLDALRSLKPAFKDGGTVTAGNSSQISDGAAAVLLMAREVAEAAGLQPRARVIDAVSIGVDPITMLTGPVPATRMLLDRNNLAIRDIDLIEVNEAFAPVLGVWTRELGVSLDEANVNVNGGAIALGHPLGGSGARILVSTLHELERRDGERAIVTMCTAGGQGTGTLLELIR
jgi:acetyl-CoA acetyltransferase family protein